MKWLFVLSCILIVACDDDSHQDSPTKDLSVNYLNESKARLAFTCAHEKIPEPSIEADILFKYARWLQKNNQLKKDPSVGLEIERLYRIAAENNHYKANINLQNGGIWGDFQLDYKEYLRLSQGLIDANVATGYYFVGIFLEQGAAGLKADPEMALRFYRKAADTGSPQAQYLIAEKLAPIKMAPDIARQMRRCAADQGHGKAARALGVDLSTDGHFQEALGAFQLGVAAGDSTSAFSASKGFRGPKSDNRLHYLGQQEDSERAERYEKIWRVLANYSHANPTVPEINEIVPLPPAPLPEWDGKLQWLETRLANVPPGKPSEILIHKLAKEKVLDPATGKPMPGSPGFNQSNFPLRVAFSGSPCPESGYWKVMWSSERAICRREVILHLKEGAVFPKVMVERFHLRPWPLSDKTTRREDIVEWGLLG